MTREERQLCLQDHCLYSSSSSKRMIHRPLFPLAEILLRSLMKMKKDLSEIKMLATISRITKRKMVKMAISIHTKSIRVMGMKKRKIITIKVMVVRMGNTTRMINTVMSRNNIKPLFNLKKRLK